MGLAIFGARLSLALIFLPSVAPVRSRPWCLIFLLLRGLGFLAFEVLLSWGFIRFLRRVLNALCCVSLSLFPLVPCCAQRLKHTSEREAPPLKSKKFWGHFWGTFWGIPVRVVPAGCDFSLGDEDIANEPL